VYPYESRWKWLFSSRYNHILAALELAPGHASDSLLHDRAASLRRWDRVRTAVMVLLYLGFVGAALAYAGNFLPVLTKTTVFLGSIIRIVGALTGLFTLAFLFLTRLLSQIEADILMLLAST
jgi:hypothetical protein